MEITLHLRRIQALSTIKNYFALVANKFTLLSCLLIKRLMFLRCVITNNAATTIEKVVKIGFVLPNAKFNTTGNAIPANIDERETILKLTSETKNTINENTEASGKIQITIPKIVATPLPPLKPAKIGKICPTKAATPKPNCKLIKLKLLIG